MPSIKGIKCSLVVSKLPAQEFGTTIEGDFASTYVVAEAHEHFYLNVVTTEFVHRNLEIYVYIDGKYQNSSIWTELDASTPIDESYYGKRVRDGEDPEVAFERPWKFDALIEGWLVFFLSVMGGFCIANAFAHCSGARGGEKRRRDVEYRYDRGCGSPL